MTTPDHTIPVSGAETSVVVSQSDRYQHVKRGTVYEVIGTAKLQAEQLQGDHAALTIYRGEDGKLWARNTAEFQDGRFTRLTSTPQTASAMPETFLGQLRRVNLERYEAWVEGADAGIMFDALELGGEVGELLNVVKKLEREERGWRGSRADPADFADECADVLICLDKLARRRGVDLAAVTIAKFNATSDKMGLPHKLAATPPALAISVTAERAVMICPQCEGEGGYPDGADDDACYTDFPRCGSNGSIVDVAMLAAANSTPTQAMLEAGNIMFHRGETPLNIWRAMQRASCVSAPTITGEAPQAASADVREAATLLQAGVWLPIESAPKDGSVFFARGRNWGRASNPYHVVQTRWAGENNQWRDANDDSNEMAYLTEWFALAAVPAHAPSAGEVEKLREALDEVIRRAREMPRRTPAAGGCATVHQFPIEAGVVWMLDKALTELDAALATPAAAPIEGDTCSTDKAKAVIAETARGCLGTPPEHGDQGHGSAVDRLSEDETARANEMLDLFARPALISKLEPTERRTIVRAMLAYGDVVAGVTNSARDADAAPIDLHKPVETDEADPRAVTKDPFDWPAGRGANAKYMGSFVKREPDGFTHQSALWNSKGAAITDGAPNLRNTLAAAPTGNADAENGS